MRLIVAAILLFISTYGWAASCTVDYTIRNQWNTGFVADVTVTNQGGPIDGWTVEWSFAASETIQNGWNSEINQRGNAVTVKNAAFNASVDRGQSLSFGFVGYGQAKVPPNVRLNGDICAGQADEPPGQGTPDSPADDNPGTADPGDSQEVPGEFLWSVDNDLSTVSFVSTKKIDISEIGRFDQIEGGIDANGNITIAIKLDSVNTAIDIRDERMRTHLFETNVYNAAIVTAQLDLEAIDAIPAGTITQLNLPTQLNFHGVIRSIDVSYSVTRLSDNRLSVSTIKPIIINAEDYGLLQGLEILKQLVSVASISTAVPVGVQVLMNRSL